jgi:hypothetical protein
MAVHSVRHAQAPIVKLNCVQVTGRSFLTKLVEYSKLIVIYKTGIDGLTPVLC